jgi:aliphatic nitrilase
MTHSFEGKIFTIISCSTVSEEIISEMERFVPDARKLLTRKNGAFSGIIGPDGNLMGDGLIDDEGIIYAEIDLNRCIQPKQMHDILGHYNRFDIFDLRVNIAKQEPVKFIKKEIKNGSENYKK